MISEVATQTFLNALLLDVDGIAGSLCVGYPAVTGITEHSMSINAWGTLPIGTEYLRYR